uniref:Uncharacterized protein n=1 Tax=Anguilla anguilla TaxID=7936 RepID=A0A0E9PJA1_ANGAN
MGWFPSCTILFRRNRTMARSWGISQRIWAWT